MSEQWVTQRNRSGPIPGLWRQDRNLNLASWEMPCRASGISVPGATWDSPARQRRGMRSLWNALLEKMWRLFLSVYWGRWQDNVERWQDILSSQGLNNSTIVRPFSYALYVLPIRPDIQKSLKRIPQIQKIMVLAEKETEILTSISLCEIFSSDIHTKEMPTNQMCRAEGWISWQL